MNKKKVIVIVAVAAVVICAAFVAGYQLTVGSNIREQTAAIETCCEEFEQAERSAQVEIYHKLESQYEAYQNSEKPVKKALEKYETKLQEIKSVLSAMYDEKIAENTIENIEESKDKTAISTAKENLGDLLVTIQAENIAAEDYESKINELVKSYHDRLIVIKAAEAEAIAEQAAEAKVAYKQYKGYLGSFDMDNDGIPELIVQDYKGEDDNTFSVYTYKNGSVTKVGDIKRSIVKLCRNVNDNTLVAHELTGGNSEWEPLYDCTYSVSISDGKLVTKTILGNRPVDGVYFHLDYCVPLNQQFELWEDVS